MYSLRPDDLDSDDARSLSIQRVREHPSILSVATTHQRRVSSSTRGGSAALSSLGAVSPIPQMHATPAGDVGSCSVQSLIPTASNVGAHDTVGNTSLPHSPVDSAGNAAALRSTVAMFPMVPISQLIQCFPTCPNNSASTQERHAPASEGVTKATMEALLFPQHAARRRRSSGTSCSSDSRSKQGEHCGDPDVEVGLHGYGAASVTNTSHVDNHLTERLVERIIKDYTMSRAHHNGSEDDGVTDRMFTASVLSVSTALERISRKMDGASVASGRGMKSRLTRCQELAASHSTRVPQRYWIVRDPIHALPPVTATPRSGSAPSPSPPLVNSFVKLHNHQKSLTFPSTNPGNRPEVYLLAHTLDKMLHDTVTDRNALVDPKVAFAILPADLNRDVYDASENVLHRYTESLTNFVHVLDVGLSEVARQIASSCIERASLLDSIRQMFVDTQTSLMNVVRHCKDRAYEEALRREEYDETIMTKNRLIVDARARIVALETRVLELEDIAEANVTKAQRFDVLVDRMDVKEQQRQRNIVRAGQVELIDEVDEIVSRSAIHAAHALIEEQLSQSMNAEDRDFKSSAPVESPAQKIEREKRELEQQQQTNLYDECVRLMATLRDAVAATDAACAPFYKRMLFGTPELNTAVSGGKWAAIGRAIGEHETLWDHRQRVMKAHALWLEIVGAKDPRRKPHQHDSAAGGDDTATDKPSAARDPPPCTVEQLRAMGLPDVTPDEVMLLQDPAFDRDAFLHPQFRIPQRWGLDFGGVAQMLGDVQCTFQEITLRMRALTGSGLLADVAKPHMEPPSRPADPCVLCGRKDLAEIERRQNRHLIEQVTREVQMREAEASHLVRTANQERDALQSQCQELQEALSKMELRLEMLEAQRTNGQDDYGDGDVSPQDTPQRPTPPRRSPAAATSTTSSQVRDSTDGALIATPDDIALSRFESTSTPDPQLVRQATQRKAASRRGSLASVQNDIHSNLLTPQSSSLVSSRRPSRTPVDIVVVDDMQRTDEAMSMRRSSDMRNSSLAGRPGHSPLAVDVAPAGRSTSRSPILAKAESAKIVRRKSTHQTSPTTTGSPTKKRTARAETLHVPATGRPGQSSPLSPERREGSSSNAPSSPPLVLNLVIQCKCCSGTGVADGQELLAKSGSFNNSRPPSVRSVTRGAATQSATLDGSQTMEDTDMQQGEAANTVSLSRNPSSGNVALLRSQGIDEATAIVATSSEVHAAEDCDAVAVALPPLKSFTKAKSERSRSVVVGDAKSEPRVSAFDAANDDSCDDDDDDGAPEVPISGSLNVPEGYSAFADNNSGAQREGPRAEAEAQLDERKEERRRTKTMWNQMEEVVMHKLKTTQLNRLMSVDLSNTVSTPLTVPRPPTVGKSRNTPGQSPSQHSVPRPSTSSAPRTPLAAAMPLSGSHEAEQQRMACTNSAISCVASDDESLVKSAVDRLLAAARTQVVKLGSRLDSNSNRASVRPVAWVLHHAGEIYKAKRLADATAEHDKQPYLTPEKFVFVHFKRKFGATEVVLENLYCFYASCKAHYSTDPRITQFLRFVGVYDVRTAAFFLQLSLYLEQCSVGLDYSVSHAHFAADDAPTRPEVLCLRRVVTCLTESGLCKRAYSSLLWKTLTHKSFTFAVPEATFFASLNKAGMAAEAMRRTPPKSWSDVDVNLARFVVYKSAVLSIVCHLEAQDAKRKQIKAAAAAAAGHHTQCAPDTVMGASVLVGGPMALMQMSFASDPQ